MTMKWPWYRGPEASGKLEVTGKRLDANESPLRASVNPAYGDTGFQPTLITFPTPGCWQVTGRAGDASLTFVTRVIRLN